MVVMNVGGWVKVGISMFRYTNRNVFLKGEKKRVSEIYGELQANMEYKRYKQNEFF